MIVPGGRNSFSMNLSVDTWSKVSEFTHPPADRGEITSAGTRKPKPTGPRMLPQSDGGPPAAVGATDGASRYSPANLPPGWGAAGTAEDDFTVGRGVSGGTWSKKPPFSS